MVISNIIKMVLIKYFVCIGVLEGDTWNISLAWHVIEPNVEKFHRNKKIIVLLLNVLDDEWRIIQMRCAKLSIRTLINIQ